MKPNIAFSENWLTNIGNPRLMDLQEPWMTDDDKADRLVYLSDKVVGPCKPTDKYTADQLAAMGLVGVYRKEQS